MHDHVRKGVPERFEFLEVLVLFTELVVGIAQFFRDPMPFSDVPTDLDEAEQLSLIVVERCLERVEERCSAIRGIVPALAAQRFLTTKYLVIERTSLESLSFVEEFNVGFPQD